MTSFTPEELPFPDDSTDVRSATKGSHHMLLLVVNDDGRTAGQRLWHVWSRGSSEVTYFRGPSPTCWPIQSVVPTLEDPLVLIPINKNGSAAHKHPPMMKTGPTLMA